jgi:hypothetical protein
MNPRVVYYAGEYLEAVAAGLLLLALIVLVARWANRHYGPADVPDDDGETL